MRCTISLKKVVFIQVSQSADPETGISHTFLQFSELRPPFCSHMVNTTGILTGALAARHPSHSKTLCRWGCPRSLAGTTAFGQELGLILHLTSQAQANPNNLIVIETKNRVSNSSRRRKITVDTLVCLH